MRFLVISDIHADTAYMDVIDAEFKKADAVLFAGDFTNVPEPEKGIVILDKLLEKQENLLAVTGNCDQPAFLETIEKKDVSVQGNMIFRDGLWFAGAGGALKFTGASPNERTEDDVMSDLQMICDRSSEYEDYPFDEEDGAAPGAVQSASESVSSDDKREWNNLVLIVHHPPYKTKLDKITAGIHVGSPAYRAFIEEYQPLVAISGHVHESAAIDTLGKTTLINPGSLAEGRYALLEVQKQKGEWIVSKAELKEIRQ